ncbi:hypothetical protein DPMN_012463 [Dreissena polymorpha]|uniref:Uncharacterized protein n=1 Tax=Dreissena polymorpha TaxID=45954 RepID=A0A9D4N5V2_DREPO|nr:hypothetical protein DPMN_012463 [Dreissena polymorpha]
MTPSTFGALSSLLPMLSSTLPPWRSGHQNQPGLMDFLTRGQRTLFCSAMVLLWSVKYRIWKGGQGI